MPILKDVEIHYVQVHPKRPSAKFDPAKPTWSIQIRTADKATADSWKKHNIKVKVEAKDDGTVFFKANMRRRAIKADGDPATPVSVVDKKLRPLSPNGIGGGTIANVLFNTYTYNNGGKTGVAVSLKGLQITKLVPWKGAEGEEFEAYEGADDEDEGFESEGSSPTSGSTVEDDDAAF